MNPAKTLSDRFRTQRTDRIRVDGTEVVSLVELRTESPTSIEVVVEQCRDDVVECLVIESKRAPLSVLRTVPVNYQANSAPPAKEVTVDAIEGAAVEFVVRPERRSVVRLWNAWNVRNSRHAWVGNAGIIVVELDPPPGADRRMRLWCSDGLGNATFDDLVVLVTIGPALFDDGDERDGSFEEDEENDEDHGDDAADEDRVIAEAPSAEPGVTDESE